MSYLLDTNIVSELRKGARCNPNVKTWAEGTSTGSLFLSVITLGEIRKGVELLKLRDVNAAEMIEMWLENLTVKFAGNILPVCEEVADDWGKLNAPSPQPTADSLIAATALIHGMTVVTRNTSDFANMNVRLLNPFL